MRFKMNRKNDNFVNIDKLKSKKVLNKITDAIVYSPEEYGVSARYTGAGVKILVIDSGAPKHKSIKTRPEQHDFIGEKPLDEEGHGTIVAGLISSKDKNSIIGIAPDAKVLYAKVANEKGNSEYNALVSSILWGIVKNVDVIVMALGSQYNYTILHDAIKKARNAGILIFAAAGNNITETDINYPARYPEVYSVGNLKRIKKVNEKILEKVDFALKNKVVTSTYLNNKFIQVSGSSISTAFVAGLASLLIEKNKKVKKINMPKTIYSELQQLIK